MTPHIEARVGDYAETVLVPGDPLRALWIAETFLDDAVRVNAVRGCYGFTGHYRGRRVSVQASGIGRPSFAIYVHELAAFYGVTTVLRIGSCGALVATLPLREIFVARSAVMDTDLEAGLPAHEPDQALATRALQEADRLGLACHQGALVSSDTFYHPRPETRFDLPRSVGIAAVDMETAGLFAMARRMGFRAASLCTVVDSLVTGEETALSERHEIFRGMVCVALEVAATLPPPDR